MLNDTMGNEEEHSMLSDTMGNEEECSNKIKYSKYNSNPRTYTQKWTNKHWQLKTYIKKIQ